MGSHRGLSCLLRCALMVFQAPNELRIEVARAGRSVCTPSVPHDGGNADWDTADALRVSLHMFKSDTFDDDGAFAQKNMLIRLKDGVAGRTLGAARLDLSCFFNNATTQVEVELLLNKMDAQQQTESTTWSWFKSGNVPLNECAMTDLWLRVGGAP